MITPGWTALRHYFNNRYAIMERAGQVPYRLTAKGAWAYSGIDALHDFFLQLDLHRYRCLVDLGSGDGIVVCLAGLFTRAVGIEIDSTLCSLAGQAARDLGLSGRVDFIRSNFTGQKICSADCLYVYPDKPIYGIESLLGGWQGDLLVYGPHFAPARMKAVHRLQAGTERMVVYRH